MTRSSEVGLRVCLKHGALMRPRLTKNRGYAYVCLACFDEWAALREIDQAIERGSVRPIFHTTNKESL